MSTKVDLKLKKSLGQNFLHSTHIADEIVRAAFVTPIDTVLEIGPGDGCLTERLLASAGKVIAIEKDRRLIPILKQKFAFEIESNKFVLIEDDALNFNPASIGLKAGEYKIVANIPYYVTGAILEKFLTEKNHPSLMTVMIQKEVAERIMARDGKESILSVSVKVFGKPRIMRIVSRAHFKPQPKVDSAVITISEISNDYFDTIPEKFFFSIIKTGFGKKRKKLLNNLSEVMREDVIQKAYKKANLGENIRAEDLSVTDWKDLVRFLSKKI